MALFPGLLVSATAQALASTDQLETTAQNTRSSIQGQQHTLLVGSEQDLLKYSIPLLVLVLLFAGYFFYRRRVARKQLQTAIAKSRNSLRAVIDTAPARVFWKDRNSRYLGCNMLFARDAGMAHPRDLIGKDDHYMPWVAQAELYRADDLVVMKSGIAKLSYDELQLAPTGQMIWRRKSKVPLRNRDNQVIGLMGIYEDITERKKLEEDRKEALSRLQKITSLVPGVVFQFLLRPDGSSCFPYASDAMTENFLVSPEEVREDASKILAIFHPDDHHGVVASIQSSARDLTPWRYEFRVKFADGTVHWLLGNAIPQKEENGAVLWHGFVTEITEHKRAEAVFHGLFDQSIFLAGILDQQGRLIKVNNSALLLTDTPREELIGKYFPDTPWWSNAQDRSKLIEGLNLAYTGSPTSFEASHTIPNGRHINVMFSVMPISLEDGIQVAVVGVDVTARRQLEDQVRQMAFHDALTKLPNRRLLSDRLSQTMAASKRSGRYGALMFLDLDNFKPLNDTHGHDLGDLLLIEVAARLKSCVREIDTVGRLGGDEFVVLLSDLNANKVESTLQAEMVAEKVRITLAEPYLLTVKQEGKADGSVEHHCTASIGVVVFINHETSQDDILKWADAAMYQAKDEGRNTVRFHALKA